MADIQGNIIKVDGLVKQLNDTFAKHIEVLDKTADKMSEMNIEYKKLPSGYLKFVKELEAAERERLKTQRELTKNNKELANQRAAEARALRAETSAKEADTKAEQQNTNEIKSKIPTLRQLATINRQNEISNQKLTSSWYKLNQSLKNAEARYRELAATQGLNSRKTKQAQAEVLLLRKRIDKINFSIKRFNSNVGNYTSALSKSFFALRNFASAFGVFSASFIALDIFKTVKEIDSLDKALKQVTETTENYNEVQLFLKDLADEAGVEINTLQKSYTKFLAAAKTTNLTINQTNDIFRQTAKAGAVLGLSTDDINGAFRALEQILSKGKVQAEEIRGQLGERLPGAFQILAKSMDLTTQELSKQLELGNVISEEVLPNFARELEKTFGLDAVKKVETLTASQNRLSNSWNEFIRSLDGSEGTLTRIFSYLIDSLNSVVKGLATINTTIEDFNDSLENKAFKSQIDNYRELGDEANAYAEIRKENAERNIENITKEIEKNKEVLKQYEGLNAFQKLIRPNAREAQKNIDRLSNSLATQEGILRAAKMQLSGLVEEIDKETDVVKKNTIAKKENIKATEDTFGFLKGTIPYYEEIIKGLKSQQEELSRTSKEWYAYQEQIDDFTGRLEVLQRMLKGDYSLSEGTEKAGEMIDKLVSGFSLDNDKKEEVKSNWKDTFNDIVNVANRAFGIITALSDASFQKQYDNLERKREIALSFEGQTAEGREEIERQYEEKRKAIEQRQAKAKKEQALFNITVDTASAVVQALPNIPLAVVIGALGAAQLALVASQQIPQFWEGGIVGGSQQIMVNDDPYGKKGANYKEVVRKPNGQTLFPQGKNVKMTVPKGTEIFPTYDAFMSSLNTELGLNGIGLSTIQPNVNVNGGITESQIRSVMAEHGKSVVNAINNKTEYHVNWDENGMNKYIVKGNTKREVLNARFRGRGRSV